MVIFIFISLMLNDIVRLFIHSQWKADSWFGAGPDVESKRYRKGNSELCFKVVGEPVGLGWCLSLHPSHS